MCVLAPPRTPHRAYAARACLAPRAPRVSVVRSFVRTPSDTKNLANFWTEATTQFGDPGATFYMQDTGLISMNNSKGGSQASPPPLRLLDLDLGEGRTATLLSRPQPP